jgi:Domain of unknown function (DUF4336)
MDTLTELTEGVWLSTETVRFLGLRLTVNMVVLRLAQGGLLLYSPVRMTDARRAAVEALGPVSHLYAPNSHHFMWIGEWSAAFPSARVHAAASLARKARGLRTDRTLGSAGSAAPPEPAFAGALEEIHIDGFRLDENVVFHVPSKTMVVADLVHNVGRPTHLWTVLYSRVMGFYDRVALSRMIRFTAFPDRAAARRSVDAVLARPFERLVVGHGAPIAAGALTAPDALAAAYAWLR